MNNNFEWATLGDVKAKGSYKAITSIKRSYDNAYVSEQLYQVTFVNNSVYQTAYLDSTETDTVGGLTPYGCGGIQFTNYNNLVGQPPWPPGAGGFITHVRRILLILFILLFFFYFPSFFAVII